MASDQPPPVLDSPARQEAHLNEKSSHPSTTHSQSTFSEPEIIDFHEDETPTASHALASSAVDAPHSPSDSADVLGAAQIDHDDIEVKNLGWNDETSKVPRPVVGGLNNEELWTLVRRFNKQVFHVKSLEHPPLANLDMGVAEDDSFSPDKLRAQVERFYIVIAVALFSFWKHIVRVRSWRETKRTSIFLGVYAAAWIFDVLLPMLLGFLIVLIAFPQARDFCFPPAPPSLIDSSTGGLQKPAAGVLASNDSVTGAPEKHQGEAVEQEAQSFVNSITSLVVSTATGKDPQGDPELDEGVPDPSKITELASDAKNKAGGSEPSVEHDRTKQPIAAAVWTKARPALHMLSDLVDTWERFGNALSPTSPFPRRRPRLILASCLVPALLASYFTTPYMAMKGAGFGAGFGFFGDPIITPMIQLINRTYPRWQKFIELRNTLLRGVPTNAQLTVTLLRIGEKNKAPIPPPPSSNVPPPVQPHETAGEGLEHLEGASDQEIQEAIQADPEAIEDKQVDETIKPKKTHRIISLIKGTAKGSVQTAMAADKAKAKAGIQHAKNRLGVIKHPASSIPPTGPIRFPARYKGKKGHVYITATATTPAVSWTSDIQDVVPSWSVAIAEIEELKKVGGLGWKSKIVVGWALGREVVDGLVIRTKKGKDLHVTAVSMRDELFNRLIAMGSQMWELG